MKTVIIGLEELKIRPETNEEFRPYLSFGTEGRNRTGTARSHRFLRPTCLPIPPLRQGT